jgi:hypothetical protein
VSVRDFATVVSGVPRSGTSLLMQMLAAGGVPVLADDERPADDDNPRGYFEYTPVKASARDATWTADAPGRAVKVIHALLRHLPDEGDLRIILIERDPDEVLASQRRMIGGDPNHEEDTKLATVFQSQLAEARAWAAERPRTALLEVDHRELMVSPEAVAARIDVFLGGGLDVPAMARCVDPDLYRNRSSYDSDVRGSV